LEGIATAAARKPATAAPASVVHGATANHARGSAVRARSCAMSDLARAMAALASAA